MSKTVIAGLTLAASLIAFDTVAQTAVIESENNKDEINIREDGGYDRSIGRVFEGDVDSLIRARQRSDGHLDATKRTHIQNQQSYEINSVATGNSYDVNLDSSMHSKSKQRQRGHVRSRLDTRMERPAIEVKLNATAFGNTTTLNNNGAMIVDSKQRQDGGRIEAIIITDLAQDSEAEDSLTSNAVALGNNFYVTGPDKNFGGDLRQRSDADVEAYNQTTGASSTPRVQSTAIGNSISVSRK